MAMQYTVRNIPRYKTSSHMVRRAERRQRMVRAISEAGPEVVRDGMVEFFVDSVEEELLFSVGHEMMKGGWGGMGRGRLRGGRVGKEMGT